MSDNEGDLAAFYDQEAADRIQRPLDPHRERARTEFIQLLRSEGRSSVIEVGGGTGRDAGPLVDAGFTVAVADLSPVNVALCRHRGADARVASVLDLPWPDGSFDAGFTMSTLLHVTDADIDTALVEITRVLVPDAPLAVGLWGGVDEVRIKDDDVYDPKRRYVMRSDATVQSLLGRHGTLEVFETWPSDRAASRWHYQWGLVRVGQS